jgi:hypothetical protein
MNGPQGRIGPPNHDARFSPATFEFLARPPLQTGQGIAHQHGILIHLEHGDIVVEQETQFDYDHGDSIQSEIIYGRETPEDAFDIRVRKAPLDGATKQVRSGA